MSETRGRGRGRGRGTTTSLTSGGRGGGQAAGSHGRSDDKPKREPILDLSKYLDQQLRVKFTGGREVTGVLKGYDQLLNLVMDEVEEQLRDAETGELAVPQKSRTIGLTVLRGTSIVVLNPVDGSGEIPNPFAAAA